MERWSESDRAIERKSESAIVQQSERTMEDADSGSDQLEGNISQATKR